MDAASSSVWLNLYNIKGRKGLSSFRNYHVAKLMGTRRLVSLLESNQHANDRETFPLQRTVFYGQHDVVKTDKNSNKNLRWKQVSRHQSNTLESINLSSTAQLKVVVTCLLADASNCFVDKRIIQLNLNGSSWFPGEQDTQFRRPVDVQRTYVRPLSVVSRQVFTYRPDILKVNSVVGRAFKARQTRRTQIQV